MGTVRVQVSIPQAIAGVGTDAFVNTWHFRNIGTGTDTDSANEAIGWLTTFYQAIDARMPSGQVDTPAIVKAYSLSDDVPRAPIVEDTIDLTFSAGTPMPHQVACCLSYRATYESGVPKGRRRGRVYLGPFLANVNAGDGRPLSTFTDDITAAAEAMRVSSAGSSQTVWIVHSRIEPFTMDQSVLGGWVDDVWDLQRRRALEITHREEFGAGHS